MTPVNCCKNSLVMVDRALCSWPSRGPGMGTMESTSLAAVGRSTPRWDQMHEGVYGLGGALFTGQLGAGSTIRLDAADSTSMEVEYLQQPDGGNLDVSANGQFVGSVSTAGAVKGNGAASVALPAGTKMVHLTVQAVRCSSSGWPSRAGLAA